jgi:hypothetical protein
LSRFIFYQYFIGGMFSGEWASTTQQAGGFESKEFALYGEMSGNLKKFAG